MSFDMSDYVDVAERIRIFRDKHPEGTLQSEITLADDGTWVLCKAFAYRGADDKLPGIGHSRLLIPGSTPYTRGSEVENAETSAWGRAIVAALAADTKKIASAEEVRAKDGGGTNGAPTPSGPHPDAEAAAGSQASSPASPFQAPNRVEPTDGGQPEQVVISFGKHKGKTLAEVDMGYRKWLVEKFEAKTAEQRRIQAAARILVGAPDPVPVPDDDIPF